MKRLLSLYFYRLVREKGFWIIFGLIGLAGLITGFAVGELNAYVRGNGSGATEAMSISQVALLGLNLPFSSSIGAVFGFSGNGGFALNQYFNLGFVALIVIPFFIGKEWRYRTIRNQILCGEDRTKIFLSALVSALAIALACFAVFEACLWFVAGCFGAPVFLQAQVKADPNISAHFALSFFLALWLYLVMSAVACSWNFIISNSWGALALFYVTFLVINVLTMITEGICDLNHHYVYQLLEWLPSYQFDHAMTYFVDRTYRFVQQTTSSGDVYFATEYVDGRAGLLALKTILGGLILGGGMSYLGILAFKKKDLK
jgi:hypothetical protein